ncbi:unnamed protein product, partial [Pylaiella littoralis]
RPAVIKLLLRLELDGVLHVMRCYDGRFTWYSFRAHLEAAMKMVTDLNLLDARKVLTDTIARGNRLVAACSDPVIVLGVSPRCCRRCAACPRRSMKWTVPTCARSRCWPATFSLT